MAHTRVLIDDDLSDDLFKKIVKYVYDHARITLGDNKKDLVKARFGKVIRQRNMSGFKEYYQWMVSDDTGEAVREVMNAIATNLTSFFRENQHFEYLGKKFLPALAEKHRSDGHPRLRGWSAGCSTGEEIYTILITTMENLPDPNSWDIKFLASDIDTEVVAHGHRGIYTQDRLKDVSPALVSKYFNHCIDEKGKPAYQVKDNYRRLVAFRHLNLFSEWPFKNSFDFIFCRNVMIYFDRPTQEQLVNRFYNQLKPGGVLFIGHSESLTGIQHKFDYVQPTVYLRKS